MLLAVLIQTKFKWTLPKHLQSHNYHSSLIPITNKGTVDFLQTIPRKKEEVKEHLVSPPNTPTKLGGGGGAFFRPRISREIGPAACTKTRGNGKPITRKYPLQGDEPESISLGAIVR
ncbi:hypothetical protein CDAR_218191 [Caerostris darwini]|uniref:Uncharacterized protein n=1 Tax=Caerostris darwini TaxID=1538125 RepID=A0AAV4R9F6_9ARAC|nr:hypothetical protein CDAR_218191 [Caerostris darwini]